MATTGFDLDPPELYALYCDYTRLYLLTFFPASPPPIYFHPYGYVSKGDPVHIKACEYMAGQSVLFEDKPPKNKEYYARRSYGTLLVIARDKLGHVMTDEEREAVQKKEGTWIEEITNEELNSAAAKEPDDELDAPAAQEPNDELDAPAAQAPSLSFTEE